jgi:hypothetical protein
MVRLEYGLFKVLPSIHMGLKGVDLRRAWSVNRRCSYVLFSGLHTLRGYL